MMNARQQGDVRLVLVTQVPATATMVSRTARGLVLAEGEATGHAHVVTQQDAELFQEGDMLYLRTPTGAVITHEEHQPVTLTPGIWRVRRVREKDMLEGFVRQVVD